MANENDNLNVVKDANVVKKPEVAQDQDGNDDDEFINSLLDGVDTEEESEEKEEEIRRRNKDAEEARKRRAAEAKVKEEQPKPEPKKVEETVKEEQPEQETKQEVPNVNKLGEQLVQFKSKYPDVDLANLDNDKTFKKFIDGKLLGKKDFTKLYEEYVELKAEITGVEQQVVQKNYQKAKSSSGSSISPTTTADEVYSEEDLRKISQRLPFMNPKEAAKIEAKLKKSIAYYEGNK
jgi:hypothetical protein